MEEATPVGQQPGCWEVEAVGEGAEDVSGADWLGGNQMPPAEGARKASLCCFLRERPWASSFPSPSLFLLICKMGSTRSKGFDVGLGGETCKEWVCLSLVKV